ncbi:MAG: polysaccharide ABC transporter ATP-binding protein [Kovacikia sp.]
MSDPVICVENLSKKYVLAHQQSEPYVALRDVLVKGAKSLAQALNPIAQNSKLKTQNSTSEEFWALKEVSFEIRRGDRVGIIGRNGAGKSTLLKILSRITEPTSGRIRINGRVASLLEVGTGFHPELTGRENIFLNGAILGMNRIEIQRKFDEIVAFAEIEKFLDTPVKRYSSGMYVRLAFAVAAHLEPEILIVDEVLAVGDAAFQKKCLGKMEDVAEKEGRTVLFVSHNMGAISQLTTQCLFLERGRTVSFGATQDLVKQYFESSCDQQFGNFYEKLEHQLDPHKPIEVTRIEICPIENEKLECAISYIVRHSVKSVVAVKVMNASGVTVTTVRDTDHDPDCFVKQTGHYLTRFDLPTSLLAPGKYFLTFSLADMTTKRYDLLEDILSFEIELNCHDKTPGWSREGVILQQTHWTTVPYSANVSVAQ